MQKRKVILRGESTEFRFPILICRYIEQKAQS